MEDRAANPNEAKYLHGYLYEIARQAGLENDIRVVKARLALAHDWKNPDTIGFAKDLCRLIKGHPQYIRACQARQLPFSKCPEKSIIESGEVKIGRVFDFVRRQSCRLGISLMNLTEHLLVTGRSGSGKTSILLLIILNFIRLKVKFLVLDNKRDFRCLVKVRGCEQVHVLRVNSLSINILRPPPGVNPITYAQIFTDVFFEILFGAGCLSSKNVFLENMIELFNENDEPTLYDLDRLFEEKMASPRYTGAKKERIRTIRTRFSSFLHIMGPGICVKDSYRLEDLLEKQVVIELDSVSYDYGRLMSCLLFYWIFSYRLKLCERGGVKHFIVSDECKNLLSLGLFTIAHLVSTAREMGEGLIAADQIFNDIDASFKGNIGNMICLNISSAMDMGGIAASMGLTSEQKDMLNRIPKQTGVVKLSNCFPDAFLATFDSINIEKSTTDEEVEAHMAKLAVQADRKSASEVVVRRKPNIAKEKPAPVKESGLSREEDIYLTDIRNNPFEDIITRNARLQWTNHLANKVARILQEKRFVEPVEISLGLRGRPRKFMKLLPAAEAIVGKPLIRHGKGDFEHCLIQHCLLEFIIGNMPGLSAAIEECLSGKGSSADVGILLPDGRHLAAEVVVSNAYKEYHNLISDIESGYSEVVFFCKTELLEKVREECAREAPQYMDRAGFHPVSGASRYFSKFNQKTS